MPKFSKYFKIKLTQHELDFVDVSNEYDTRVYVDPFAIEVRDDIWAAEASEYIRIFFKEILDSLRDGNMERAQELMNHLHEPKETYLGVSRGSPQGRGVGSAQSRQLISAIRNSEAFRTGLLTDLSEMSLYVEGIDRDKISDLTTNIIRSILIDYTNQQCSLYGIPVKQYSGPPCWDPDNKNWISKWVRLPFIKKDAVMLVPKYIVRRNLSINSQDFYNKQITDFLVAENLRANTSLVRTIKGKKKVLKKDVREQNPKSKNMIAEMVRKNPELLNLYKEIAVKQRSLIDFGGAQPSVSSVCTTLANQVPLIPTGSNDAENYHRLVQGALTAVFYPYLIHPRKEWEIHDGRKRVDIVFTNAADVGFFAHRRNDHQVNANALIVECKNYAEDVSNPEIDQLLGRFDNNRGKLGMIVCRAVKSPRKLMARCRDAAVRSQGYIIPITDDDLVYMLAQKAEFQYAAVESLLHLKYRELLS